MPVRVLVLGEGAGEPLLSWSIQGAPATSPDWEACALKMLSWRGLGEGQAEIYLCLSEDLRQGLDCELLAGLIEIARHATWDAEIYLVVNSRQSLAYAPLTQCDSLGEWFETALGSGIKDLLEVWVDQLDQTDPALLRAARVRAAVRNDVSHRLVLGGRWRVVTRTPASPLGGFLAPFTYLKKGATSEHQLILAVDKAAPALQHSRVSKDIERLGDSVKVVAALGAPSTQRAIALCGERGIGR